MSKFSRSLFRRLKGNPAGNVTLLLAVGMPVLVGGAGLAVDIAQWYLWKRELQYSVDQAALAGAWAQVDDSTRSTYQDRATQEFDANLQTIADFHGRPTIGLGSYNGGFANSVVVRATAGKLLPFSGFLTGKAAQVGAYAQATFQAGGSYKSCLVAVDPDAAGAITIGGNASVTATCGIAALSTSEKSIIVDGSPTVDVGWILSKGGVDEWLSTNTDDAIHDHMDGLFDPYKELKPPNNPTPRTYGCTPGATSTTADITISVQTTYSYYKGANQSNATAYNYSQAKAPTTLGPTTQYHQTVPSGTNSGATISTTTTWTVLSGSGQNKIWEKKSVATTTEYSNVIVATTPTQASLSPGTYSNIDVSCTTVFRPGIYVIDGGRIKITGQYRVTGSGVMFVLKNGAYFDFTGGSNINLTAMSSSELETAGVSAADAAKLAGMLIFEDPNSKGTKNKDRLNGNSKTVLNGTVYLPNSNLVIDGTFDVTSRCLMIAASQITIQGDADLSTFCPAGMEETVTVANSKGSVRLVS